MAYVNAYRSQMLHAFPFFDELHCEKPTQDLVHGSFRLATPQRISAHNHKIYQACNGRCFSFKKELLTSQLSNAYSEAKPSEQ